MKTLILTMSFLLLAIVPYAEARVTSLSKTETGLFNWREVRSLNKVERKAYFQLLRNFAAEMEKRQPKTAESRIQIGIFEEAEAQAAGEKICVVSGFFTTYKGGCFLKNVEESEYSKAEMAKLIEACGSSAVPCNPVLFGFESNAKPYCVSKAEQNMTENCLTKSEGNLETFLEKITANTPVAITEIEAQYERMAAKINAMCAKPTPHSETECGHLKTRIEKLREAIAARKTRDSSVKVCELSGFPGGAAAFYYEPSTKLLSKAEREQLEKDHVLAAAGRANIVIAGGGSNPNKVIGIGDDKTYQNAGPISFEWDSKKYELSLQDCKVSEVKPEEVALVSPSPEPDPCDPKNELMADHCFFADTVAMCAGENSFRDVNSDFITNLRKTSSSSVQSVNAGDIERFTTPQPFDFMKNKEGNFEIKAVPYWDVKKAAGRTGTTFRPPDLTKELEKINRCNNYRPPNKAKSNYEIIQVRDKKTDSILFVCGVTKNGKVEDFVGYPFLRTHRGGYLETGSEPGVNRNGYSLVSRIYKPGFNNPYLEREGVAEGKNFVYKLRANICPDSPESPRNPNLRPLNVVRVKKDPKCQGDKLSDQCHPIICDAKSKEGPWEKLADIYGLENGSGKFWQYNADYSSQIFHVRKGGNSAVAGTCEVTEDIGKQEFYLHTVSGFSRTSAPAGGPVMPTAGKEAVKQ